MNNRSKTAVTLALLAALVFVSVVLDRYLSAFLPVGFAVITLTVTFSFGLIHDNPWILLSCGLVFGLCSFLTAVMTGVEAFVNPLVSVVPRMLIGPAVLGMYRLLQYALRNKTVRAREHIAMSGAAATGALVNTVAVVGALVLFGGATYTGEALKLLVLVNALPELVLSAVLVPLVVLPVRKALRVPMRKAATAPKLCVETAGGETAVCAGAADDGLKTKVYDATESARGTVSADEQPDETSDGSER